MKTLRILDGTFRYSDGFGSDGPDFFNMVNLTFRGIVSPTV